MRIRTANGVGLVRLCVVLVVVLVVMSGSAAFGQQSGRVAKSKKATAVQSAATPQSGKKGTAAPVLLVPKEADVKIQGDYTIINIDVDADGPADGPRSSPPPFTMPASPYNSAGGGSGDAPGGGSSSGSTMPPCDEPENAFCTCSWQEIFPPFDVGDCKYSSTLTQSVNHTSRIECPTRPIAKSHVCLHGSLIHWMHRLDAVQVNHCDSSVEHYIIHRGTDYGSGGGPPRKCSN